MTASEEELLNILHQKYVDSIPEKMGTLILLNFTAEIDELKRSYHMLKGTGHTYRVPEASQLGELMEKVISLKPGRAVEASNKAINILKRIFFARKNKKKFALHLDEDYQAISALL
jgi:hypothetical protein